MQPLIKSEIGLFIGSISSSEKEFTFRLSNEFPKLSDIPEIFNQTDINIYQLYDNENHYQ